MLTYVQKVGTEGPKIQNYSSEPHKTVTYLKKYFVLGFRSFNVISLASPV